MSVDPFFQRSEFNFSFLIRAFTWPISFMNPSYATLITYERSNEKDFRASLPRSFNRSKRMCCICYRHQSASRSSQEANRQQISKGVCAGSKKEGIIQNGFIATIP